MRGCGALRIDHVMGLRRLWWVPPGFHPSSMGRMSIIPAEELLAILALESHRERCMVIGEDLGTVPPEMRTLLHANGVYSYKVFFFERAADGGYFAFTLSCSGHGCIDDMICQRYVAFGIVMIWH